METYAPIFSGFYETEFGFNVDVESVFDYLFDERKFNYKQFIFLEDFFRKNYDEIVKENYNQYTIDVAKNVCEFLSETVSKMLDTSVKFEFQNIHSPKYYNFSNDSINVDLKIDNVEEFMNKLLSFIHNHIDSFKKYIKDNYTSCDGFMSYYSNDVNDWLKKEYNEHEIGSLIEFALREHNKNIYTDMVYYVLENVYADSYVELKDDFKAILESDEMNAILKEYERLMKQKEDYFELMKEIGKKPNYEAVKKQEEKNNNELFEEVLNLLK